MKYSIHLCSILLLSGCVSLKQTKQSGIRKVDKLNAFNGVYENTFGQNSGSQFSTLWSQLKLSGDLDSLNFKQTKIEIIALGEDQIKAVWLYGNERKAELVLNGRLKDNYFVSKHKRTIIPIPLIYGRFKNNQFQFALSESNNLLVDRLENQWGWVFLFLANKDMTQTFEYKKLDR